MANYKIVIKKSCFFCEKLLDWLKDKDVKYKVLDYQDPKDFKDPLMKNPTFNS
jgi:arsenate reductase-like glutaredoxin family protein